MVRDLLVVKDKFVFSVNNVCAFMLEVGIHFPLFNHDSQWQDI